MPESPVDRVVRKFRESPSPVLLTPQEHKDLCSFYGAIIPNDYENPFMGKVIQIRELEFDPYEGSGQVDLPIGDTFIPQPEPESDYIAPLADDLYAQTSEPEDEYDENEVIDEDPNA